MGAPNCNRRLCRRAGRQGRPSAAWPLRRARGGRGPRSFAGEPNESLSQVGQGFSSGPRGRPRLKPQNCSGTRESSEVLAGQSAFLRMQLRGGRSAPGESGDARRGLFSGGLSAALGLRRESPLSGAHRTPPIPTPPRSRRDSASPSQNPRGLAHSTSFRMHGAPCPERAAMLAAVPGPPASLLSSISLYPLARSGVLSLRECPAGEGRTAWH